MLNNLKLKQYSVTNKLCLLLGYIVETINLIIITGASGATVTTFMKFIRIKEGPGHVETYIRENMAQDKKIFEPYFDLKRAKFNESETVPEMDKEVPVFFCHDPDGFIDKECEILGRSPDDIDKKLGIDSGKGSNKLTLTMREKEQYQIPRKKSRVTHKDSVQVERKE